MGPSSKQCSYKAAYKMKSEFIKDEIKRCAEQSAYEALIVKLSEKRRKEIKKERNEKMKER